VIHSRLARTGAYARIVAALVAPFVIASCGSGAVGPPPVNDPSRITILPASAILFSGIPTTFTISGGTGFYIVGSSNQSVVAASGPIPGSTLTVIPANVLAETEVTLTVRDTGTTAPVNANLTVRPGTVANDISVIPTSTQGGTCAPAVCSGGDAIVTATISQGGNPLPARGVRLDVVSGDFRFITSPPNQPEVLETSTTVITDQNGAIHARIRVLPGAPNQTALVQVTDLGTQAFRRAPFQIAQATGSSPGFFATPESITFTGPNDQSCAIGGRADVFVFGGTPPYSVGGSGSAFGISNNVVATSGGSFYVVPNGTCVDPGLPITIADAAGRTTSVTVSNVLGELTVPELLLSPGIVTLSDCSTQAMVSVAGGTGNFTVTSGSGALFVSGNPGQRLFTVGRVPNTPATTPLQVGVASGNRSATVTVNLTGDALNTNCDNTGLRATPSAVTLASCGPVDVTITGGSPPYAVRSDNSSVTAALAPGFSNFVRIQRTPLSQSFVPPASVTVTDNNGLGNSRVIPVQGTGSAAGSGTGPC
jgi:hypothetical protein